MTKIVLPVLSIMQAAFLLPLMFDHPSFYGFSTTPLLAVACVDLLGGFD